MTGPRLQSGPPSIAAAGGEPGGTPLLAGIRLRTMLPAEVKLEANKLKLAFSVSGPDAFRYPEPRGALTAFLNLKKERPETLRDFVLRYGTIFSCRGHGRPICDECHGRRTQSERKAIREVNSEFPGHVCVIEDARDYFFFSNLAKFTTRLCTAIKMDTLLSREEWRNIQQLAVELDRRQRVRFPIVTAFVEKFGEHHNLIYQRMLASLIIDQWLEKVTLGIEISSDESWINGKSERYVPAITLATDTMGALGLQLLGVLTNGEIAQCHGCQQLYPRQVSPNRKRKHYCLKCREDGTAERQRKRNQRARQRLTSA